MKKGKCFLVGAGPGDPGLLTLRGNEVLSRAEVVVYDNLANPELLGLAPETAELLYAGKKPDDHSMAQEEINRLLVEQTAAGRLVVRLKGGDPYVFGRGAEEAGALAAAGLDFEVVPGVSSALAGPAAAGIAVTRRGVNEDLGVFTGHQDPESKEGREFYRGLGARGGTLVMLMGLERLSGIARELQAGGAALDLPVAVVRRATMGDQVTVRAPLSEIADRVAAEGLRPPAVVVFGAVASVDHALLCPRPLTGRRIVVTRSRAGASKLAGALRDLGADVYEMPLIKREEPENLREFAELVQDAHSYEWIVFTSANGVDAFFEIFYKLYDDAREIGGTKFGAVGAATAQRIKDWHFHVDLVAEEFQAKSLAATFRDYTDVENVKMLAVRPAETSGGLALELTKMGAIVDEAIAYRTVAETTDRTRARQRFAEEGADLVVFTSSSTVRNFFALKLKMPKGLQFASIGPVTTGTMAEFQVKPSIKAKQHDINGLVQAISAFYTA